MKSHIVKERIRYTNANGAGDVAIGTPLQPGEVSEAIWRLGIESGAIAPVVSESEQPEARAAQPSQREHGGATLLDLPARLEHERSRAATGVTLGGWHFGPPTRGWKTPDLAGQRALALERSDALDARRQAARSTPPPAAVPVRPPAPAPDPSHSWVRP